MKKETEVLTAIGWREWISLPDWNVDFLKAKVDTGARTSSLHAENLEYFIKDSKEWVRFVIYPWQRSKRDGITQSAEVISKRVIKSSSGCQEMRPVIKANLLICDKLIEAEISLTNRNQMGFRMLLGREAIRKKFHVIVGKSYLGRKPALQIKQKNKGVK